MPVFSVLGNYLNLIGAPGGNWMARKLVEVVDEGGKRLNSFSSVHSLHQHR